YNGREFFRALIPVALFYLVAWYGWLLAMATVAIASLTGLELPAAVTDSLIVLNMIAVVFLLPNQLRQVSLQILSSSMHYYGDVENQLQETQVMNSWWLLPLQLFTFNFGST